MIIITKETRLKKEFCWNCCGSFSKRIKKTTSYKIFHLTIKKKEIWL